MIAKGYRVVITVLLVSLTLGLLGCERTVSKPPTEYDGPYEKVEFDDMKVTEGQEWEVRKEGLFPRKKGVIDPSLYYSTILSYSSDSIDFRLVNYHYPSITSGFYDGPHYSTSYFISIEEDVELVLSCDEKWVYSKEFVRDEYEVYGITIDINHFIGKCAYGEDVLVELVQEELVIYSDTYLYDNIEYIDTDYKNEFDFSMLDEHAFIDLFLNDETSGYFSTKDIVLDVSRFGYKEDLRPFKFNQISFRLEEEELDYSEIEELLGDILDDYENTRVCSVILTNFFITDCVRTGLFDTTFLIELDQSNDDLPNKSFRIGLGYYDNESTISMFIRGSNKHGLFQFRITEEYSPEIKELYDYLYCIYEHRCS